MSDETYENLITLEQSLRKTYNTKKQLITEREELRAGAEEVTPEEERITQEIKTLELMAKQTEAAIYSLLKMLRGNTP